MLNINMFWLQIDIMSYIICILALYHINMNNNVRPHFQGQKHIWMKCAQIGYDFFFISCHFPLLIINVKILFNFQKGWCTFGRIKEHWKKKKECSFFKFECFEYAIFYLFMSSFEHINFPKLMKNIPKHL
jgi:hypothetical protein